jgi:hypothetical protein
VCNSTEISPTEKLVALSVTIEETFEELEERTAPKLATKNLRQTRDSHDELQLFPYASGIIGLSIIGGARAIVHNPANCSRRYDLHSTGSASDSGRARRKKNKWGA